MHSSYIKMLTEHCPQALSWEVAGREWITDARLGTGVTAHAILEGCKGMDSDTWATVADAVVNKLTTEGYKFDEQPQSPINLEEAQEGAQLALRWLDKYGSEPDHAHVEIGLAIDANGDPCRYEEGVYQAVVDVVRADVQSDEESEWVVLTVADYKSSWQADASELETLQRKGQAVVANAHFPEWDILRLEVRNLRTMATHTMELVKGDDLLKTWRSEVLQACRVANKALQKPVAAPGAGCVGCPYIIGCPDAEKALQANEAVHAWVVAKAAADALGGIVRKLAKHGPIPTEGGTVEYRNAERSVPNNGCGSAAWDYWHAPESRDSFVGLLNAAKLGVTQIRNIAKQIEKTEGSAVAEDFVGEALTSRLVPELKVTKDE